MFSVPQLHCPIEPALDEVFVVWMPHSVLVLPRQRPARASSPADERLEHGRHPTEW
jgi:hypothetical protein